MLPPRGNGTISVDRDPEGNIKICVHNDRHVGSRGIFYGESPFNFVLPDTLFQVLLVLCIAQIIHFLTRPIKTPKFICMAWSGILVGPSFLGHFKAFKDLVFLPRQLDALSIMAVVGCIYIIFIVSLKTDVALTLRSARRTWKLGILPSFLSFVVAFGLLCLYDRPNGVPGLQTIRQRCIFSINVCFSNFPVIAHALVDLNLLTSELGQIALSSSMVNDIVHFIYVVVMYLQFQSANVRSKRTLILILLGFCGFMGTCAFIVRPLLLTIARKTPVGKPVRKDYVILVLLGVLFMAFLSDFIGLSFIYGPVFYGLIMPNGPPLGTTILDRSEFIINEFFTPLFWAFLGLKINVFAIWNWDVVNKVNSIVLASYIAKVGACVVVARSYKIRIKHGFVLGLILNMKGIIETVVYTRMQKIHLLDDQIFYYLVFSVFLTTMILHPFVLMLYKPYTRLDSCHDSNRYTHTRLIQNTYRNPEFRVICCVHNEGNVRSLVSLIEACNPMVSSTVCAYVVHMIELLGKSTPFLLPVDLQKKRFASFNFPITNQIMRAFDNYSQNSHGLVTVLPYVNVSPYKNMHEAVCNLAHDKLVSFLILPFHENDQTRGSQLTTNIRDLNSNFHVHASCTVGILVDRYSQLSMVTAFPAADICFHLAIFFVGGADDREALALGSRMSGRLDIRVTLFWFVVRRREEEGNGEGEREEGGEEEEERIWDESFVDEFRAKNMGNEKVIVEAIMVEDGIHVLEAIRGLERNYDMVMVGERHNLEGLDDKEMSNFMENVGMLGILGDMLASTEFCNGMVPVLVVRCGAVQDQQFTNKSFSKSHSLPTSHKSYR